MSLLVAQVEMAIFSMGSPAVSVIRSSGVVDPERVGRFVHAREPDPVGRAHVDHAREPAAHPEGLNRRRGGETLAVLGQDRIRQEGRGEGEACSRSREKSIAAPQGHIREAGHVDVHPAPERGGIPIGANDV